MARTSLLSKVLIVGGAVAVLKLCHSQDAFVTPKLRGEAAATLAAAMVAASVAAPGPVQAEVPKLSFFGLGGGVSDVYNQNDNPVNPYSQFSVVDSDSVYKARSDTEVARRKKALAASFERWEKTPFYIKTKQSQQLTSNLQEAAGLKQDMLYFSEPEGSDAWNKAKLFSQKVSTVGVDGRNKEWGRANQDFEVASNVLKEWKALVKF